MVEVRLNRDYAMRMAGIGVLMLGICIWSLYDGYVVWPQRNDALAAVRDKLLAQDLTAEAWVERDEDGSFPLQTLFSASGLRPPAKLIKKLGELKIPASATDKAALRDLQQAQLRQLFSEPVYRIRDLSSQSVQAGVTLILALLVFGSLGFKARQFYHAGPEGLSGSGVGGTLSYQELEHIDWRQWDEKGIAVLKLRSGKRIKLDGWHFAGMPALVDEILKQRPDLAPAADDIDQHTTGTAS